MTKRENLWMRTSVVKSSICPVFWIVPDGSVHAFRCSAGITHYTFGSVTERMIGISWRESRDNQSRCLINVGDLQIPFNDKQGF